jgi:hypothetical protein
MSLSSRGPLARFRLGWRRGEQRSTTDRSGNSPEFVTVTEFGCKSLTGAGLASPRGTGRHHNLSRFASIDPTSKPHTMRNLISFGGAPMFRPALCAIGVLALAGSANASSISVNVYSQGSFSETGNGITFSGLPAVTATLSVHPNGFYVEWDGLAGEVPASWRPIAVLKPVPPYGGSTVFGADFRGQLVVARSGSYTITFGADDAGYLLIDGVLQASTPSSHAVYFVTPTVTLNAGIHRFEIQYANEVCCRAITALSTPSGITLVAHPVPRPRHRR